MMDFALNVMNYEITMMGFVSKMMDFVLKMMNFELTNDEFCIKNDELCNKMMNLGSPVNGSVQNRIVKPRYVSLRPSDAALAAARGDGAAAGATTPGNQVAAGAAATAAVPSTPVAAAEDAPVRLCIINDEFWVRTDGHCIYIYIYIYF